VVGGGMSKALQDMFPSILIRGVRQPPSHGFDDQQLMVVQARMGRRQL